MKRQSYTVKKAFPHRGGKLKRGEKVQMHPREAKYLLGTHLEHPAAKKAAPKKTAPKKAAPKKTEGGSN